VAVFAGLLGALGLLIRKGWSRSLLFLSLLALLVQFGWWIFISGAMEVIGPSMLTMPIVVIVVGIFLVWIANHAAKRGWLT
jgi:MFS superfamily sulfate permease-like transporter